MLDQIPGLAASGAALDGGLGHGLGDEQQRPEVPSTAGASATAAADAQYLQAVTSPVGTMLTTSHPSADLEQACSPGQGRRDGRADCRRRQTMAVTVPRRRGPMVPSPSPPPIGTHGSRASAVSSGPSNTSTPSRRATTRAGLGVAEFVRRGDQRRHRRRPPRRAGRATRCTVGVEPIRRVRRRTTPRTGG